MDHLAAVKAIAWSPHQHGLLASGGGTADRCIRFWNTLTSQPLQCMDTGSQVCNLAWSKHANELVSVSTKRQYIVNLLAKHARCICMSIGKHIKMYCFTGEHSWILTEPDLGVEIPISHPGCQTHRTLIQSAVPGQFYFSHTAIKMLNSVNSCFQTFNRNS